MLFHLFAVICAARRPLAADTVIVIALLLAYGFSPDGSES